MPNIRSLRRICAATVAVVAAMAPAAGAQTQQDVVTSDNVEHVSNFRAVGDGVGARIVGNRMFVTSTTHLMVFDITDAENPELLGAITADVEFENEDVPTNGKVLGISGSISGSCVNPTSTNCLNLYDVSGDQPELLSSVDDAGDHTQSCVLDCTWFYGSDGVIVDARDPANAVMVEERWTDAVTEQGYEFGASPHDVTEVAPGIVVTSSQPLFLLSLRPEHGGSPQRPVVLATGNNEDQRFIHSVEWPREGRDKWLLVGGETVIVGVQDGGPCSDEKAAFMTWDSSAVANGGGGWNSGSTWTLVDEVRPYNGTYADGGHVVDAFGCSVHWFQQHPTFRNGGLVAVSAYEHGTRLYQVAPDGKIIEQGYALPIVGAASAPHWHPEGKVFYTIDYERGMDIWRYTGETYQGPADASQGGGSGPGGSSGDAPSAALQFSLTPSKTSKSRFLKSGLRAKGACSRACSVRALLKKGRRTIARGSVKRADEAFTLRLKVSKATARKLRRSKRLSLRLVATATAEDGRSATLTRRVVVK